MGANLATIDHKKDDMTNKRQTEPPTVQPTAAPASAESADTAPPQISESARLRLQEAYRMIHAIAADIEDEKRRSAEEAAAKETGA